MSAKKAGKGPAGNFYVVGVGASAGGLEAINQFLSHVPDKSGFAYVIVQHLSPDYKSLMGELLTKHTQMRVFEATDRMRLKPDCVYLLPSKKTMTLSGDRLVLHEKEKGILPNNTIDIFFESLANEKGTHAIGIILSGTGTDGTKGAEMISTKGGIVVVQDPGTSAFNGMPNSAIASGVAHLVLPPQSMAGELIDYINDPYSMRSLRLHTEDDEAVVREIIVVVRKATGQDFSHYKYPTLIRRLAKRMGELNIPNIHDYLAYLNNDSSEIRVIVQNFLINVTHFFRDPAAFDVIKEEVIPAIVKNKGPNDSIKLWVVACSSGEEAYSLAILFHEYLERNGRNDLSIKIFATDVDVDALEIASKGVYTRSALDAITGQRLARYFEVEGENYRVKPEIRKMVVFSRHDVLRDPPFGRLDLVSCRNMLIYINAKVQKEILRKLHFSLRLNGYLFVGPSEHVDAIRPSLEEVDKKWRIYKCVSKARMFDEAHYFNALDKNSLIRSSGETKTRNPLHHQAELFKETLLEDGAYAGIFIDRNFEVKQAMGNYKNYLHFPESGFNFNLLKLVHPDLSVVLSPTVRKATEDDRPITVKGIRLHLKDMVRVVTLYVKPYLQHTDYALQFLFIVLKDEDAIPSGGTIHPGLLAETDRTREEALERELKETRENLQAVIEEMEATNEELQSANEELVSANEELQSTNEELQSLNEELHTVSTEHQLKIKELIELNDDLNNYFKNSEIGQLLVDKNLIIRKFSPSVTRMVNLIPSDIHRSLMDITTRFGGIDFIGEIGQVIRSGIPIERQLALDEQFFLMRINPYERHDKKIDGVVVSFIDITRVRQLDNMLEVIYRNVPSAIMAARAVRTESGDVRDFEVIAVNPSGEKSLAMDRKDIIGKTISRLFPGDSKELIDIYREVLRSSQPFSYDYFSEKLNRWSTIVVVRSLDGIISVSTDITEKKKAADLVQQNYEELRKSLRLSKKKT